jgi:hypothetical protein
LFDIASVEEGHLRDGPVLLKLAESAQNYSDERTG